MISPQSVHLCSVNFFNHRTEQSPQAYNTDAKMKHKHDVIVMVVSESTPELQQCRGLKGMCHGHQVGTSEYTALQVSRKN
jgi:hypothetical protein